MEGSIECQNLLDRMSQANRRPCSLWTRLVTLWSLRRLQILISCLRQIKACREWLPYNANLLLIMAFCNNLNKATVC